ncbi:hypothetical protein DEJ50_20070 [Streptomyces venezuelae]|uniref:Septum formation-related domain-containing protein n=1 Tax=Streptomyces venezuelae TaxID=54571 RepID=A0A5P2D6R3_STRVZ|nr:hypothetical protein [Streptomyces venezuelae]QES49768.1 hypothetical protein DEJ50_20070 [Streptomyces venezuelae]
MHIKRFPAVLAALLCLATLSACEDGKKPAPAGSAAAPASSASPAAGTSPAVPAGLAEAQRYVQKYVPCEDMSTDPRDRRLPRTGLTTVGKWSVTERGVCSDRTEGAELIFYMASDMKEFQAGYKKHVQEKRAGDENYGLFSRVFVGKNFAVTPTGPKAALALSRSDLRILTCHPSFWAPKGYKQEKALVDYCVLSDFVHAEDGTGSPNFETPTDPAGGTGGPEKPGQPAQGSLGLPSAAGMAELKKLVHPHTVDCTTMSTASEDVAVESIDYRPAVSGDPRTLGITQRAVCGNTGGAQRAHDLNWLDVVGDMTTLQRRAKAAQQEDLKDGRLSATTSRLLVGENIAVETNDESVRFGLYQLQFLALECRPGFKAPAGYRLERAKVEGCVLTNYEG